MKTNIRNYRGGAFSLAVILSVIVPLLLFLVPARASIVILDGTSVTNWNVANCSWTNTAGAVTNNYQNGQVPGASNVLYQLSTSLGDQPYRGTNIYLPALPISMRGNYPNSLTAPSRMLSVEISGYLMATNATSTAVVFQFAKTDSGKVWMTNAFTAAYTIAVNSTTPTGIVWMTNIDTGGDGFYALQQINNPGVAALTNIIINMESKPGL